MTRKSTALNDRLFTTHSVFRLRRRIAAQDKVLNRTLRELQHFDYDGSYQDMDLAKGSHRLDPFTTSAVRHFHAHNTAPAADARSVSQDTHTPIIVLLRGRDSSAADLTAELFESLAFDARTLPETLPNIGWVFPTADIIHSARFETDLSQWPDMYSTQNPHERHADQEARLYEAAASIAKIVNEEAGIVGSDHVFLGGISHGCATAVHTLLQISKPLAGLIGLCSWLPE
ncbi:hypothetical protein LTR35_008279 [Friedmanniomyces endolithicus]|uniref:Phospholipase/carboxylesterase/thioesterase domain-containing protein n=1 Tax=Friedmanniomyces endolithicus TaxID=329885 RepID=A0AAN6JCR6_9PEZI|nr:hypothetical protein LTR35_008279 [Friedmanniomyces endolithicus]KAK0296297.1 hypothetical protein LTS00_005130 [Friedmanniomyces endolithicus]KAK0319649.1 hypothetical protein LTR82_009354 [Friedmanniomyces endolithicus]KAK1004943.1 hypothetical protein LTR54_007264 [Friedmanniomyces endolithicus]